MDTCLWNNRSILASDISKNFNLEKEIRLVSGSKELICSDPQCGATMIYRHGEKKDAHFAHVKKSDSCDYYNYDHNTSSYIKKVKTTLFYHFKNLGYNIKMDIKLLEHNYTHLAVIFNDDSVMAIELRTTSVTAKEIEKLSTLYFNKNIILKWIVIDNIETNFIENQTYHIKRLQLNESSDKTLIVINFDANQVVQYKIEDERYQYNNFEAYSIKKQKIFQYGKPLSELIILNKEITLINFNESYEKWQAQKLSEFNSYIEKNEIKKKLNHDKSSIENLNPKQNDVPFIIENIFSIRTQNPPVEKMYFPWTEDDFKILIKKAVNEDRLSVIKLINKVYECNDNELAIFYRLLNITKAAQQNNKTVKCIKILEHVLRQAKRL